MKLIDKIKNAIFEEEELEEQETIKEKKAEEIKQAFDDEVVKKIDIEKTIPKKIELPKEEKKIEIEEEEPKPILPKREHRITPVIFDDDDFVMEDEPIIPVTKEVRKEEVKKPLYSGYRDEKQKEKFKPSPIISPVYGFVGVSPVLEKPRDDEISSYNEIYAKEKKETVTLDTVRQKAYGVSPVETKEEEDDDLGLLYDMKQEESPAISKITLGDAEEYFDDLGLEYNVDYKDTAKERKTEEDQKPEEKPIEKELEKKLESTAELEITKEQMRPKTAKEIKKVTKIKDLDISDDVSTKEKLDDTEEPDEKNLYDLIDMMYESKE